LPNEQYRQFQVCFAPEDLLIFYSDGVTEAADDQRQMYGVARLQELIAQHHFRSPAEIAAALRADLERFTGADHFNDDVTCIVVSIESHAKMTGWFEPDAILEPIFTADPGQATVNYPEIGN
jgi:sigma-B regulation protein RsbU (phosphoserine phosphatase)